MAAGIFHLTNNDSQYRYAIEQGATFSWFYFVLDGDYTGYTPRGQIRDKYAAQGGIIKATFIFHPLVYTVTTLPNATQIQGTVVYPHLTSDITKTLDWYGSGMKTRFSQIEPPIPGVNVWVYDIELVSPDQSTVFRVLQGFVEVSLEATN